MCVKLLYKVSLYFKVLFSYPLFHNTNSNNKHIYNSLNEGGDIELV